MPNDASITVHLTPEVNERLDSLARQTRRTKANLVSEAIENYVELQDWQVEHIKAALAEDEAGGPGVPHEEVVRWMASWDTPDELPQPEPKNK